VTDNESKQVEVGDLNHLTTIDDLKLKIFEKYKLRPSRTKLFKSGQHLHKEHCTLLFYGVSHGSTIDAVETTSMSTDTSPEKMRIFVKSNFGFAS